MVIVISYTMIDINIYHKNAKTKVREGIVTSNQGQFGQGHKWLTNNMDTKINTQTNISSPIVYVIMKPKCKYKITYIDYFFPV